MTLTAARSIAARVFTEAESAQNHYQIGHMNLALKVILLDDNIRLPIAVDGNARLIARAIEVSRSHMPPETSLRLSRRDGKHEWLSLPRSLPSCSCRELRLADRQVS